eukprot:scaffold1307_cov200-Pinguiococcus_pyrenoidosus.AAC.25
MTFLQQLKDPGGFAFHLLKVVVFRPKGTQKRVARAGRKGEEVVPVKSTITTKRRESKDGDAFRASLMSSRGRFAPVLQRLLRRLCVEGLCLRQAVSEGAIIQHLKHEPLKEPQASDFAVMLLPLVGRSARDPAENFALKNLLPDVRKVLEGVNAVPRPVLSLGLVLFGRDRLLARRLELQLENRLRLSMQLLCQSLLGEGFLGLRRGVVEEKSSLNDCHKIFQGLFGGGQTSRATTTAC